MPRTSGLALGLVLLGLASTAWAQAGDATAGKVVYERKCVGCHGDKGDGKGPAGELLSPAPRDFTKDRKSTRLNSSHIQKSRMPSSA